ncbi:MAG: M23 family metallopeptidase [Desulfoprunum sp.]|nr:M23 family metallopeptidase [Desulfoprunum sp.]
MKTKPTRRLKKQASISVKPGKFIPIFLITFLLATGIASFFLFFEGEKPTVSFNDTLDHIGKLAKIRYTITDSTSGIQKIRVTATQGETTKELYATDYPRTVYIGKIGPTEDKREISFDPKKLGFKEGKIQLTIEAHDFSLRGLLQGNKTLLTKEITVDLNPPSITLLHSERYISPGSTGIAIYRISEPGCKNGVMLNGHLNPGYPLGASHPDTYISYFTLPYDAEAISEARVIAADQAENATSMAFSPVFQKIEQKFDRINITDGFLSAKIPEFEQHYPEMKGTPVEKYLYANNTVRDANNTIISGVCQQSTPERLWKGKFLRMLGSPKAGFADHRTYFYQEKEIDKQVHLGVDIASTEHIGVQAANTGKVVYADYLGIYGNAVILDHGQGVFSLYSHLSQINAAVGDKLEQGKILGLTGTSGMAGGDHLHFSMIINGVFTMPKEWWDPHWIEVTIESPLVDSKI